MRQSDVYKINVPELGDRSDITVVSDAILAGEKNTIGNVQWMKATNSGNIITLTSETRTAKMSKYYNGLAVQFVSPISITSASGAQIKVDNLEAQPFTTTNDIEIGNVVCAVYSTSGFTANKMGVAVIDNLTTADSKKALSANQGKVLNEKKADKTIQVIAGNGLTGGGDLNANRTLNVASANDGITVNANNIQLNTVDNLTTTSTTKPLSANQGKILSEKVDNAVSTVVNKLDRGSLPENIANAKDLYSLLENNGGLTFDTNCTYIQESKQKNVGYVYFDRNTKGLFECYKTAPASVVINDAQYFRDISNKANSDRLTNLYDFTRKTFYYGSITINQDIVNNKSFSEFMKWLVNSGKDVKLLYGRPSLFKDLTSIVNNSDSYWFTILHNYDGFRVLLTDDYANVYLLFSWNQNTPTRIKKL